MTLSTQHTLRCVEDRKWYTLSHWKLVQHCIVGRFELILSIETNNKHGTCAVVVVREVNVGVDTVGALRRANEFIKNTSVMCPSPKSKLNLNVTLVRSTLWWSTKMMCRKLTFKFFRLDFDYPARPTMTTFPSIKFHWNNWSCNAFDLLHLLRAKHSIRLCIAFSLVPTPNWNMKWVDTQTEVYSLFSIRTATRHTTLHTRCTTFNLYLIL